jgi:hypothetical protein
LVRLNGYPRDRLSFRPQYTGRHKHAFCQGSSQRKSTPPIRCADRVVRHVFAEAWKIMPDPRGDGSLRGYREPVVAKRNPMLPAIDFRAIRPWRGSQHSGFEELCCQLVSLEPPEFESEFLRKEGAERRCGRGVPVDAPGWQRAWPPEQVLPRLDGALQVESNRSLRSHCSGEVPVALSLYGLPSSRPD